MWIATQRAIQYHRLKFLLELLGQYRAIHLCHDHKFPTDAVTHHGQPTAVLRLQSLGSIILRCPYPDLEKGLEPRHE